MAIGDVQLVWCLGVNMDHVTRSQSLRLPTIDTRAALLTWFRGVAVHKFSASNEGCFAFDDHKDVGVFLVEF